MPTPHSPDSTQRVVRIFLSSTFRDMQEEREELVKKVYPQLAHYCAQRNIVLRFIDLRWGITVEQAEAERVIPICLHEIDLCRPFFVCLMGERYGWVPPRVPDAVLEVHPWLRHYPGISLTEMEIRHAALNDPASALHASFYLRSPDYIAETSSDSSDLAEANRECALRLRSLKQELRASGLRLVDGYDTPKAMANLLLVDLQRRIQKLFPVEPLVERKRTVVWHENLSSPSGPKGTPAESFEEMNLKERTHAELLRAFFVGRVAELKSLDSFVASSGSIMLLVAPAGGGKSALLAHWSDHYARSHPETCVASRFIGNPTADFDHVLLRVARDLVTRFELGRVVNLTEAGAPTLLPILMDAAERGRVIIILDGIDQAINEPSVEWLAGDLPASLKIICSVRPGPLAERLRTDTTHLMELDGLTAAERREFVVAYLALDGKSLGSRQLDQVVAPPDLENPGRLRTMLDELRFFGKFEQLDAVIARYVDARDAAAVYAHVVSRLEEDFGSHPASVVAAVFRCLACARSQTLHEEDLQGVLDLSNLDWSELYYALRGLLTIQGARLGFRDPHLLRAVEQRYLATLSERSTTHIQLAQYFERDTKRAHEDDPAYHFFKAGSWTALRSRVLDYDRHITCAPEDLMTYWAALKHIYDPEVEHLAVADQLGSRGPAAAPALLKIGRFLIAAGYAATGEAVLRRAAAFVRADEDVARWMATMALNDLALLLLSQGRSGEALELTQSVSDVASDAYSRAILGVVEFKEGRLDDAAAHLAEARHIEAQASQPRAELMSIIAGALAGLHQAVAGAALRRTP